MEEDDKTESQYQRERDAEENIATRLPEGEKVRIPAIWTIEAYTPALIGNLYGGVEKLSWTDSSVALNAGFSETINEWRGTASGGGWLNLGYIVSSGTHSILFPHREAPLPSGIRSIRAGLFQPFASTTILCCQFNLDEDAAVSLEIPLNESFSTYTEPIGQGAIRFIEMGRQKQRAVNLIRAYLRTQCTDWIAQFFPGLFCSESGGGLVPTCEFLIFEKQEDFSNLQMKVAPDFLQMLGLYRTQETWNSKDLPGILFQVPERGSDSARSALMFGNLARMLEGKDMSAYGDTKEKQIVNWVNHVDSSLVIWAIRLIAEGFISEMGKVRDAFGSVNLSGEINSVQSIRKLDARLLDLQRSALPFAYDLTHFCENEKRFLHNVYEFEPVQVWKDFEFRLFGDMRHLLLMYVSHIKETENQIRAIATQTGAMITAASNDRLAKSNMLLQRGIYWMTIVMLLLTGVTAAEPLEKMWAILKSYKF